MNNFNKLFLNKFIPLATATLAKSKPPTNPKKSFQSIQCEFQGCALCCILDAATVLGGLQAWQSTSAKIPVVSVEETTRAVLIVSVYPTAMLKPMYVEIARVRVILHSTLAA